MFRPILPAMIVLWLVPAAAAARLPAEKARVAGDFHYYDLTLLDIEGKGWPDTPAPYDRLPKKAEATVRTPVWSLSRHSAGLCARFLTDAPQLTVRWVLTSENLAMPHMPATGVSGVDLYVRQPSGAWRWVANGRPTRSDNTATLFQAVAAQQREFCLYLPLYNGVSKVEIGIPADAVLSKAPQRPESHRRSLVFYGTSITQGGCASRPGTVHTAIVGRALDRPVINLGFSGNGRMEPELAELLAELDPAVFVLDCLPNIDAPVVRQRVEPFVRRLRQSHPQTPILLVEDRTYSDAFFKPERAARNRESRHALRAAFAKLKAEGIKGLHYLAGDSLLGQDGGDTVDGSHPTDLGFYRQAQAFLGALRPILQDTE